MNGRWLVRVLGGMVVVALLLAVASLATTRPVGAVQWIPPGDPQPTGCLITLLCYTYHRPCDSCMVNGRPGAQVRAVYRLVDPCWGYEGPCNIDVYINCIPCRY